jgi:hypothetical protein
VWSNVEGRGRCEEEWGGAYARAVWCKRVESQCVGGRTPSAEIKGSERVCRDWMRTVVRQVAASEVHGTCPVTGGGVMVIV